MANWLDRVGSLSWANKEKLTQQIDKFEETVSSLEEKLLLTLSQVQDWKNLARSLTELSQQGRLTAKHILQLRPLMQQSEEFLNMLNLLTLDKPSSPVNK